MPAYRTNRMNIMKGKRKSYSKNKNPYQRPLSKVPRYTLSQGGVPNALMRSGPALQSPEIKFLEVPVTDPGTQNWTFIQPTTMLTAIIQGPSANQRIGRQIRVIGFTYRLNVTAFTVSLLPTVTIGVNVYPPTQSVAPAPFSMDIILDKQNAGSAFLPTLSGSNGSIYTAADISGLPNVNSQDRFRFLKRIEVKNPQEETHLISGLIKTNFVVDYNDVANNLASLQANNLLVTFAAVGGLNPAVAGVFRVVYIDV